MAKTTSAGVFQLPNGTWGFRYAFMLDGKQKDIRRNKDENGNPFKTERAAIKAREATIIQVQAELLQPSKPTKKRMTVLHSLQCIHSKYLGCSLEDKNARQISRYQQKTGTSFGAILCDVPIFTFCEKVFCITKKSLITNYRF